jgi:hypothetical protein
VPAMPAPEIKISRMVMQMSVHRTQPHCNTSLKGKSVE